MKKLFTAALLSLVAVAGFAQDYDENKPVAYYPAPDGVFFLGVDMKGEQPGSDIALAPAGVNLTFKAKLEEDFYGDYAWMASEYGVDELDNENLVIMRGASDELVEAPTLLRGRRSWLQHLCDDAWWNSLWLWLLVRQEWQ